MNLTKYVLLKTKDVYIYSSVYSLRTLTARKSANMMWWHDIHSAFTVKQWNMKTVTDRPQCQTRWPKAQPHDRKDNLHPADILRLPHIFEHGGHRNPVKTVGNVYKERLISTVKLDMCVSCTNINELFSICFSAFTAMTKLVQFERGDGKKLVHSREIWAGFREDSAWTGKGVFHCQYSINNPVSTGFLSWKTAVLFSKWESR